MSVAEIVAKINEDPAIGVTAYPAATGKRPLLVEASLESMELALGQAAKQGTPYETHHAFVPRSDEEASYILYTMRNASRVLLAGESPAILNVDYAISIRAPAAGGITSVTDKLAAVIAALGAMPQSTDVAEIAGPLHNEDLGLVRLDLTVDTAFLAIDDYLKPKDELLPAVLVYQDSEQPADDQRMGGLRLARGFGLAVVSEDDPLAHLPAVRERLSGWRMQNGQRLSYLGAERVFLEAGGLLQSWAMDFQSS